MMNDLISPRCTDSSSRVTVTWFRRFRGAVAGALAIGWLLIGAGPLLAQGTWSAVKANPLGTNTGTMLLLNDGSVMVQGAEGLNRQSLKWTRLYPDANGNYVNGTWVTLPSMQVSRSLYSSWVVPSSAYTINAGVVIAGGFYSTPTIGGQIYTNSTVEIYDPTANTWYVGSNDYPGIEISNSPSVLLNSNTILFGESLTANSYEYDPNADAWAAAGTKATNDGVVDFSEGQSFTLLPTTHGDVLTWPADQNATIDSAWGPGVAYAANTVVYNVVGQLYLSVTAGTSATTGNGPSGAGVAIVDGTNGLTWSEVTVWVGNHPYAVNTAVSYLGNVYVCTTAGMSVASGGPPADTTAGGTAPVWSAAFPIPTAQAGQLFDPTIGWFLTASASDSTLTSFLNYDYATGLAMGPASLMPDGSVIQFGANGRSAIYSGYTAANPNSGTWSAGPTFGIPYGPDSAPGVMMPNGLFMIAVDNVPGQGAPTKLYAYSYTTVSGGFGTQGLKALTGTPADLNTASAVNLRMLMLPNGHVLVNMGNGNIYDYTPAATTIGGNATPLAAWKPSISSVAAQGGTNVTYLLTGSNLTGISAGACFGAGGTMATNYPIVKLVNTANNLVYYAKSYNWTPSVNSASSPTSGETVFFDVPDGLAQGTYNVYVIANGISSAVAATQVKITSTPGTVTVAFDANSGTLTLTGDATNNAVTITVSGGYLNITGGATTSTGPTKIVYGSTTTQPGVTNKAIHLGTAIAANQLTIIGKFFAGDDTLIISGMSIQTLNINMGANDDVLTLSYDTITGNAKNANLVANEVFGGGGLDTLAVPGSKTGTLGAQGFNLILPPTPN